MSRGSKPLSLFVSRRPTFSRDFNLLSRTTGFPPLLPSRSPSSSSFVFDVVVPLSLVFFLLLFSRSFHLPPSLPSSLVSSLIHSRHRASSSLPFSPFTHYPSPSLPLTLAPFFSTLKRLVPSFSLRDFHNPRSLFFSRTRPIGVSLSRP